jgi:hypothetical protein
VITRKKKICKECNTEDFIFSKGRCKRCSSKTWQTTPKTSDKTKANIKVNKIYYQMQIDTNKAINKGRCICEECNIEIKEPKGMNVSHIISKGSNVALYLEPLNSYVLCVPCHQKWEFGDRASMKIYPEAMERRERLTLKYYQGF